MKKNKIPTISFITNTTKQSDLKFPKGRLIQT